MTLEDTSSDAIRNFKKRKFDEHKANRFSNKYPEGFGDDSGENYGQPPMKYQRKDFSKGNFNKGNFNKGNFNKGNFNKDNFNKGNFNKGNFNKDNFNKDNFNKGNFNKGNFNKDNFNKGNFNKGKTDDGDKPKEKPDWKKFKNEKKEERLQRQIKKGDSTYELGVKAKKVWEELRQGNCKGARREELCDQLMLLVKGKVKSLVFAHDTVRVIETLMAVGTAKHRSFLYAELKDCIVELSKMKYSKFFILKVLKYGTKEEKNGVMLALRGQVVKLMKHKTASDVIELAYNDYANAKQRSMFVQEFYGPEFRLFHDDTISCLDDAFKKHPEKRNFILKDMRKYLQPIIDKGVFTNTMVHTLLRDYLTHCAKENRAGIIEALREGLVPILHTRDGARVSMLCLWHGSNKDRKVILKSFRTHYIKIALEEHGYMVLLAAFDCVDDTEIMKKVVLNELMDDLPQLVSSDSGLKVMRYLVAPRDPMFFPPCIVKVLQEGDGNETSKKDANVRWKELQRGVSVPILRMLLANIKDWALNSNWTLFIGAALNSLSASETQSIFETLAKMFAQEYVQGGEGHPLEIAHTVKMVTYIIKCDKKRDAEIKTTFSSILLKFAEEQMPEWINSNRGCFLLVNLIETEIVGVSSVVKKMVTPLKEKLSTLTFKGAEVLLQKL